MSSRSKKLVELAKKTFLYEPCCSKTLTKATETESRFIGDSEKIYTELQPVLPTIYISDCSKSLTKAAETELGISFGDSEKIYTEWQPVLPTTNFSEDSDDSVTDKNFEPNPSDLDSSDDNLPLKCLKRTARETEQHTSPEQVDISKQGDDLVTVERDETRKKIRRKEQIELKTQGLEYVSRNGIVKQAKIFQGINSCCRSNCHIRCPIESQEEIFRSFYKTGKEVQEQIILNGISVVKKKVERKGRSKSGQDHFRNITANYEIKIDNNRVTICKKMYQCVYGISRGRVDVAVQKLRACEGSSFSELDQRGKHEPHNKMIKERTEMRQHIERYPKYNSHYSRRDTEKQYLPSHLNIKKMYDEYKQDAELSGQSKYGSYELFKQVFHETGYKFKCPKVDTCKTCDSFVLSVKQCTDIEKKAEIQSDYDKHKETADEAYTQKKLDKASCLNSPNMVVLVFDLQQVLNTPSLTTNVSFYKRLLSTYNLTIRDCSEGGRSECYMWHESTAGRGSEQIASCLFTKLNSLPSTVNHVITYSDTCGGQNRNINMAIMFSYVVSSLNSLEIIDQKFLLPGHTHLECDADHARIERAKKSTDMAIMVPRDWFIFVGTVRGKVPFKVIRMTQKDFFSFSQYMQSSLMKKHVDTEKEKVSWLSIRWLRFKKPFGVIEFKYSLKDEEPFRTLDLRRNRKGRPTEFQNIEPLGLCYNAPLPINPLKKADLLSLFHVIDEECHDFYRALPTSTRSPEIDDVLSIDEESNET